MERYVALYLRISKDKSGRVEGVRAQEKWGRTYADARWPGLPVRVFEDNDKSAYEADAVRPGFEALRAAIVRGEVEHLWTVEQSRLARREGGWFELAAELDAAGVTVLHTDRDGIVVVLDEVAGIKAVLNAAEVRKMKRRQADTLRDLAARGIPSGSTPYGYVHGVNERGEKTLHVVENQADVIRECAERVLAGWSLSSIAADLEKRGLHGPHRVKVRDSSGVVVTEDGTPVEEGGKAVTRPSTITNHSVKSWVTNATVAGIRVHQGVEVGKGNWVPILDETTWRAVRNKLAAPRVVQRVDGGEYPVTPTTRTTGRRYLLTGGTAVCAVCSAPLVGYLKQQSRKLKDGTRKRRPTVPYYGCHPKVGGKACVAIMGDPFEAFVVKRLHAKLDDPKFVARLAADDHAARRGEIEAALQGIEQDSIELAKAWGLPAGDPKKLKMVEWQAARTGLGEQEARLRRELAEVPPVPRKLDISSIRAKWDGMTLDEQREIISTYINHVSVKRSNHRGVPGIDEGRIVIGWRIA